MTSLTLTFLYLLPFVYVQYVVFSSAAPPLQGIIGVVIFWTCLLFGLGCVVNDLRHRRELRAFNDGARPAMLVLTMVVWIVGLVLTSSSHAFDYRIDLPEGGYAYCRVGSSVAEIVYTILCLLALTSLLIRLPTEGRPSEGGDIRRRKDPESPTGVHPGTDSAASNQP